ncbi:hypothetical protein NHJ13734_001379 [Beauveria thailandica]
MGAEGTYVRHPGASTAQRPLVISANSACPFSPSAVTSPHRSCNAACAASKLTAVLSSNWSLITAHCHPVIFAFAGYPSCAAAAPRPCFSAVPVTTPRCATPSAQCPPEYCRTPVAALCVTACIHTTTSSTLPV